MPDANAMQTTRFTKPWNGHVPGEVAGFTPEMARKLFDADVARFVDHVPGEGGKPGRYVESKSNIAGLGSQMLHKMRQIVDTFTGVDNEGAPVLIPNDRGMGPVTGAAAFPGAASAQDGPPEVGTNWTPAASAPDGPARPEELVGRKPATPGRK